jgi:hypothetical protein
MYCGTVLWNTTLIYAKLDTPNLADGCAALAGE